MIQCKKTMDYMVRFHKVQSACLDFIPVMKSPTMTGSPDYDITRFLRIACIALGNIKAW